MGLLVILLAACSAAPGEPQPPEIAYGHDLCDMCGMLIDQPRFAAALLFEDGQAAKFDDVGDMFAYALQHSERPVRAWFAHDYHGETWLRAENAHFVTGVPIQTPMGHGIIVFEQLADAEALAADLGGDVVTFEQLRAAATPHGHAGH
jgi:copper chaperone NosL